jgi:glucose/arabinose dehydrogenase
VKKYSISVLLYFLAVLLNSFSILAQCKLIPYWKDIAAFEKPLFLTKAPGLSGQLFVVEQRGLIYRLDESPETKSRKIFLNLAEMVSQEGSETGLLGMAFHPRFGETKKFYVSYTTGQKKELVSHIVEMQVSDLVSMRVDESKAKELISVSQPFQNHNGGSLLFGPDGYLYFSWGDGGSGGDPLNNGQNLNSLLGKIHRIDIDKSEFGLPYAIPQDNPFRGKQGVRPEIFAYGLRNVWGMAFDKKSGKLWAGDVGQNATEEIDVIDSGKNYGWRYYEASAVFKPEDPKPENAVPPVWEYSQKDGDKSVTGGFVYHGPSQSWEGAYVFGDFITGRIWMFHPDRKENKLLLDKQFPAVQPSCFSEVLDGRILVVDYTAGKVLELVSSGK